MIKQTFIMICGPAASGKTTLVEGLHKIIPSVKYRPAQAYIDLAKKYQIPIEDAFFRICQNEAINYFYEVCKNNQTVIGDQHLAIQPKKDSSLASGILTSQGTAEKYESALDYKLFDKLSQEEIESIVFYLDASPELLYKRALERNIENGTPVRNRSLKEVVDEVNAEIYYFNELIQKVKLKNHIINIDNKTKNEVLDETLQRLS